MKIRQSLFSVFLLTTVALSTSDIFPILSIKQVQPGHDRQEDKVDDNTLGNRFRKSDIPNDIFYKVSIGSPRKSYTPLLTPQKSNVVYVRDHKSHDNVENGRINKRDKYDKVGYRKEQWHNYPRQLDRLHKYLNQHHEFDAYLNSDPDDPGTNSNVYEILDDIHDIQDMNNNNEHDMLDEVAAATSPLLILKIRLAYLKSDPISDDEYDNALPIEILPSNVVEEKNAETLDPIVSAVEVKREGISTDKISDYTTMDDKKTIKKRIFSLWSRLQTLSHKGHELHHRRHLHAFYGFPDDDGSGGGTGTLTAETRATFLRPPGSPLRWG